MQGSKKNIVETKYEKIKRLNTVIFVPVLFFIVFVLSIGAYVADLNYGTTAANIMVTCAVSILVAFLAIYLPIFLVKMRKERIAYAEFYKSLDADSFYTKLDEACFIDAEGQKITVFQFDRKGFRGGAIDITWRDYNIKTEEYGTKKVKRMLLVFTAKEDETESFRISPTYKNFYIIKNYCGQEIENIDELTEYVEKTSAIDKL